MRPSSLIPFSPAAAAALILLIMLPGCSLERLAQSGVQPSFESRTCIRGPSEAGGERAVLLVNFGWHTGLLFRSSDIPEEYRPLVPEFERYQFIEVGWGDEGFYRAEGYSWAKAFKAGFCSSRSVVHVTSFGSDLHSYLRGVEVVRIEMSREGFDRLMRYVSAALVLDYDGKAIAEGPALYGTGHFYRAQGHFSVFYTCNSWVAEGLNRAGCPVGAPIRAAGLVKAARKLRAAGGKK